VSLSQPSRNRGLLQGTSARWSTEEAMALLDYRKLCPKSGHVLTYEEHGALRATSRAAGKSRTIQCESCGRTLEVCLDPGTGRSLIYPMHLKHGAELRPEQGQRPK
jgi:hypothetical protein